MFGGRVRDEEGEKVRKGVKRSLCRCEVYVHEEKMWRGYDYFLEMRAGQLWKQSSWGSMISGFEGESRGWKSTTRTSPLHFVNIDGACLDVNMGIKCLERVSIKQER